MGLVRKNKEREKWLDSIRGLACLTVFFAHFLVSIPSIGVNGSGTGKIGVWMFFLLSGFFVVYVEKGRFVTVGGIMQTAHLGYCRHITLCFLCVEYYPISRKRK